MQVQLLQNDRNNHTLDMESSVNHMRCFDFAPDPKVKTPRPSLVIVVALILVAVAAPRLGVVNDGEMSGAFSARSLVKLVTSACAMLADGVCNTPETTFTKPVPDGAGPVAPKSPVM